jgi:hypothetical protein
MSYANQTDLDESAIWAPQAPMDARAPGAPAILATALGALAIGCLAFGAIAIGRLVVGNIFIRRGDARELRIGRLTIGDLRLDRFSPR